MKSIIELRQSAYHQQLGRKMCAAFFAQQQGIFLSTAYKKVSGPVGDVWLVVGEFARASTLNSLEQVLDERPRRQTKFIT
jgi:hypothetical protein